MIMRIGNALRTCPSNSGLATSGVRQKTDDMRILLRHGAPLANSLRWGMAISCHPIDCECRQENVMEPITATVVIFALVALVC